MKAEWKNECWIRITYQRQKEPRPSRYQPFGMHLVRACFQNQLDGEVLEVAVKTSKCLMGHQFGPVSRFVGRQHQLDRRASKE
jgi:hypothetical protein